MPSSESIRRSLGSRFISPLTTAFVFAFVLLLPIDILITWYLGTDTSFTRYAASFGLGVLKDVTVFVFESSLVQALNMFFSDLSNGDDTLSTQDGVALLFLSQVLGFLTSTYGQSFLDSFMIRAISRRKWNTSPFEDDLVVLIVSPNLDDAKLNGPENRPQTPPLNYRAFGCFSLSKVYSATPGALLEIQDAVDVATRGPVLNFCHANKKTMHPLTSAILEPFRAGQVMADMGLPVHQKSYIISLISFQGEYGDKLRAIMIQEETLVRLHGMLFETPGLAQMAADNKPAAPVQTNTLTPPQFTTQPQPSFDDHLWHAVLSMAAQYEPSGFQKQLFPLEVTIPC
mmetsp:Transcript_29123/g.58539  ORF Transcript_29123/g.58539 Transcript_29123/m.58539 type:complete len:343 (-) Transcript_29123:33-1061(-)